METVVSTEISLDGQVAVVTGAGRGIGRAAAAGLAAAGARVIAVARTGDDLASLAEEADGTIEPWQVDVTDSGFHEALADLDRVDVLVNNAGGNRPMPMVDVDDETLDHLIGLNVRSVFKTAQAAARAMTRQGSGVIINMSSQMGHVGSPGRTVYCMTKHAVEGLTRAMAVELAPQGVRVVSVAPTFVETPMTRPMFDDPQFKSFVLGNIPMGRLARPEDVANAIVYLASPLAAMVVGDSLKVDGGWTAA